MWCIYPMLSVYTILNAQIFNIWGVLSMAGVLSAHGIKEFVWFYIWNR